MVPVKRRYALLCYKRTPIRVGSRQVCGGTLYIPVTFDHRCKEEDKPAVVHAVALVPVGARWS